MYAIRSYYDCSSIGCVMRASAYAEEIELKKAAFCDLCGVLLRKAGGAPRAR